MDLPLILEWVIKSLILTLGLLAGFAYTTYYERRFLARLQNRVGPNRAGPFGLLQPIADAIKLIFKEELVPARAFKFIFVLSPILTAVPALIILGVLPWGETIDLFGRQVELGIASDVNVGVLYILSITSISVYGIVLAGWSSNNKYAMMGGLRSTAQMLSYELALGLALIGPILIAESMSMLDIVRAQSGIWFVVYQPLGALIFYIAMLAEVNRAPFDMPEAEQELTAGYHTEYSGMKFALFFMGEYIKMAAVSAIFASLFLGGFQGPFVDQVPLLGPIYLIAKVFFSLGLMIWIRATLPRFRYDRLMAFGWKILLPLSLLNVFITAVVLVLLPNK
jgi:NADH-quinone oxidoreductase subunit H